MQPYIVYVKADEQGRIIAVDSSAFLLDVTGWTEIDSGFGDRFHHAQGNYFPLPIMDVRGVYRYRLTESGAEERTPEEMDADYTEREQRPDIETRVQDVENKTTELEEALDMILKGVTADV